MKLVNDPDLDIADDKKSLQRACAYNLSHTDRGAPIFSTFSNIRKPHMIDICIRVWFPKWGTGVLWVPRFCGCFNGKSYTLFRVN